MPLLSCLQARQTSSNVVGGRAGNICEENVVALAVWE